MILISYFNHLVNNKANFVFSREGRFNDAPTYYTVKDFSVSYQPGTHEVGTIQCILSVSVTDPEKGLIDEPYLTAYLSEEERESLVENSLAIFKASYFEESGRVLH